MIIPNDKKGYSSMNLLPLALRNRQKKKDILKQGLIVVPIALVILVSPYFIFCWISFSIDLVFFFIVRPFKYFV